LADKHVAQLLGYLKSARIEHGLLINFGSYKFEIRKYALSTARTQGHPDGILALFSALSAFFCGYSPCTGNPTSLPKPRTSKPASKCGWIHPYPDGRSPNFDDVRGGKGHFDLEREMATSCPRNQVLAPVRSRLPEGEQGSDLVMVKATIVARFTLQRPRDVGSEKGFLDTIQIGRCAAYINEGFHVISSDPIGDKDLLGRA
jgi:hypothetical protein